MAVLFDRYAQLVSETCKRAWIAVDEGDGAMLCDELSVLGGSDLGVSEVREEEAIGTHAGEEEREAD